MWVACNRKTAYMRENTMKSDAKNIGSKRIDQKWLQVDLGTC